MKRASTALFDKMKPKQKICDTFEVNQARTMEGCHAGMRPTHIDTERAKRVEECKASGVMSDRVGMMPRWERKGDRMYIPNGELEVFTRLEALRLVGVAARVVEDVTHVCRAVPFGRKAGGDPRS
jgi:hypothetical protein